MKYLKGDSNGEMSAVIERSTGVGEGAGQAQPARVLEACWGKLSGPCISTRRRRCDILYLCFQEV